MTDITESKPIAHELRDIARWFIHRATSEAEPETKQSHTNDAWTCNKSADEIERLREALNDAATSLNTIAEQSGKNEFLTDLYDIRAYATNRAAEARKAHNTRPEANNHD